MSETNSDSAFGKILAIIVNFNRYDLTYECLEGLRTQTQPVDVVVVDNGSTDDSPRRIQEYMNPDRERMATSSMPVGYAQAVNLGIRLAMDGAYKYVLLLGNDTVPNRDVAEVLTSTSRQRKNTAVVGAVQVYYQQPDIVFTAGGRLDITTWTTSHRSLRMPLVAVQRDRYYSADFVDFAAVLIPTTLFEQVGLLDQRYHFYWEDVDWCWRCKALGYELIVDSSAVVQHRVSATAGQGSSRVQYFLLRNRLETAAKFRSRLFVSRLLFGAALLWVTNALRRRVSRPFDFALFDFVLRRPYRF